MASIGLVSPMVRHYRKIEAMFLDDEDINVIYDATEQEVRVYVGDPQKAEALKRMLIPSIDCGTVELKVTVIPANGTDATLDGDMEAMLRAAFKDNPALAKVETILMVGDTPFVYAVFRREVVQYMTDDIGDLYGLCSTLYEDIARDIFYMNPGVFYCTDAPMYCEVRVLHRGEEEE